MPTKKTKTVKPVVGGVYLTRGGKRAAVVAKVKDQEDWPYVAVVGPLRSAETCVSVTAKGRFLDEAANPYDLIKRIK